MATSWRLFGDFYQEWASWRTSRARSAPTADYRVTGPSGSVEEPAITRRLRVLYPGIQWQDTDRLGCHLSSVGWGWLRGW